MSMIGTGRTLLGVSAGYLDKVKSVEPSNLIGLWLQNEQSGAISYDSSGSEHNGVYVGVTLGEAGVPRMGMTSPLYDGANDYNNVYSAALATAFSGVAGTILLHAKVNAVGVWTDSATRYLIRLISSGTNLIYVYKSSVANRLTLTYEANDVVETIDITTTTVDWFDVGITWDKNAGVDGEVKVYFNGVQSGSTATALGTWSGVLASYGAMIGAGATTPTNVWHGNEGPVILSTKAYTPAQMLYLSTP